MLGLHKYIYCILVLVSSHLLIINTNIRNMTLRGTPHIVFACHLTTNIANIYKHCCKMTLFLKCTYLAYKYNHSTIFYDLHIFVDIFALFVDKITAVLNIKGIQNHHIATF
ncbi:hypothetical protein H8356DRAFT_1327003 [Neocallimastix lanati (nom. inval.)]|nr:hypothetical protein H8356DRAFT_1327003 [Neocallimastix sp. JGI-2020a]